MWVLVRIAGIIVGIATLLRLATTQGLVTYDPLFQEWMDRLQDIVELGFLSDLIEPLLHRFIDWMRSFGWQLPDLNENWRPVFVLCSLYFGAIGRNGWFQHAWLGVFSSAVIALGGATLAGLASGSLFIFGFLTAQKIYQLIEDLRLLDKKLLALIDGVASISALSIAAVFPELWMLSFIAIAFRGYDAVTAFGKSISMALRQALSAGIIAAAILIPGITAQALLAGVVLLVVIECGWHLAVSLQQYEEREDVIVIPQNFWIATDILFALFGALFIASIFASPPIW
jgi:hypothetical protein